MLAALEKFNNFKVDIVLEKSKLCHFTDNLNLETEHCDNICRVCQSLKL